MDEITSAYKRLAMLIHPDKNMELRDTGDQANAVEAFKALHGAYRALKDRKERVRIVKAALDVQNLVKSAYLCLLGHVFA